MLMRPSPSTKPLAITISVISLPLPPDPRSPHIPLIVPPISLANVNEGVFKKPIANATPEGRYFAILGCPSARGIFAAEIRQKATPKMAMNKLLFSGRFPSPIPQGKHSGGWVMIGGTY
jgi:hypothetical protein